MNRTSFALALLTVAACAKAPEPTSYLYVWAGDSAGLGSDFLAVIDADPKSPGYGSIVASVPTGVAGTEPHHTEDFVAANGHLLANGHHAGRTWLFDLTTPGTPRVDTSFGDVGGFSHPHSFFRTPDGNVLATFQYRATEASSDTGEHAGMVHGGPRTTGGLVLMDERGDVIRTGSAADPRVPDKLIFPYSVLQIPGIDRAVSTTTDMDTPNSGATGEWIQFWRLSDLTLLRSLHVPPGPDGSGNKYTGEPKLLPDGKSVYIHTFSCGLHLVRNVESETPTVRSVYDFEGEGCGVPVLTGQWWLQTIPAAHALVALDISDPEHPKEVSRVTLGDDEEPHWLAIDGTGRRLVLSSADAATANRLYLLDLDPATGKLSLDERFQSAGDTLRGVSMAGRTWPHGFTGTAVPHGTVFSR
jgi:hypothetical protein